MKALNSALKNLLVSSQVVSMREADRLLNLADQNNLSLSEIILTEGILSADDLRQFEAKVAGVPFFSTWTEPVSFEALSILPEPLSRSNNIVVVRRGEGEAEALGLNLADFNKLEDFLTESKIKLNPRLTSESTIKNILRTYQQLLFNNFGKFLQDKIKLFETNNNDKQAKKEALDLILNHASLSSAKKVYFDISPAETMVNYRIGRKILPGMVLKRKVGQEIVKAIPSPYSHLMYGLKDVFMTDEAEGAVFEQKKEFSGLGRFGLDDQIEETIEKNLFTGGLFLFASEKKTDIKLILSSLASFVSNRNLRVCTIEDSLDKYLPHIKQIKVNRELGVSTEQSLRLALLSDFDCICIDNLDTPEALSLASIASNRGILVLGGVEARSLIEGFELVDAMLGDRYILASVLKGLTFVKSVFKVEATYSKQVKITDQEVKDLANFVDWTKVTKSFGQNMSVANNFKITDLSFVVSTDQNMVGENYLYKQKILVAEFMPVTLVTAEMIKDQKNAGEIRQYTHQDNNLSLGEQAMVLAMKGMIDLQTAINIATGKTK